MDYFEKIEKNPYKDLYWNVPEERKMGRMVVVGGNVQSFRTVIRVSEFLTNTFPLEEVRIALPDALKPKLPPLDNFWFLESTESGSVADGEELRTAVQAGDFALIVGDLSKNSLTLKALERALLESTKPLLVTRDAVDLIAEVKTEQILMRDDLTIFGTIMQWQKIFRSVYYPKMLMLSQSLVQIAEAFHKFTFSFPVQMVSLHMGQILIAKNGRVVAIPLEKTAYSPLTLWSGELAGKIAAMNLYNPERFIEATVAGIFYER